MTMKAGKFSTSIFQIASMRVAVTAADKGADVDGVIRRATEISSISNSVRRGVPIHIVAG